MKVLKKYILVLLGISLFILLAMVFRPILPATIKHSIAVNGEVVWIEERGGPADITLKIKDDKHTYYINRGAENGVNAKQFHNLLKGQNITIHYADHWTPLDPNGVMRHITRVTFDNQILYNEILER